jgi:AcrR family transcriptional regulator
MSDELKIKILEGTLQSFNEKGLKFTIDDVAGQIHISKKTVYTVFRDKEDLFLTMVDYVFDSIKESESEIMENDKLSTVEKLKAVLGVLPQKYMEIDFSRLYMLKDKYPEIYKKVEQRLESGWEPTIALIEQGIKEGVLRKVNIPILKMMMESSLEQFFQKDILIQNGLTYSEALKEVVNILVEGIKIRD